MATRKRGYRALHAYAVPREGRVKWPRVERIGAEWIYYIDLETPGGGLAVRAGCRYWTNFYSAFNHYDRFWNSYHAQSTRREEYRRASIAALIELQKLCRRFGVRIQGTHGAKPLDYAPEPKRKPRRDRSDPEGGIPGRW